MNKLIMTLMAMTVLFAGCATSGSLPTIAPYDEPFVEPLPGYVAADGSNSLPEIAPYDEEPIEPLPAFVPAK